MVDTRQPPEHAVNSAANPAYDPDTLRAALRSEKIAARLALAADEHRRLSALIDKHLTLALTHRPPGVVAFCWPIRNEFDARPLVGRLLAAGWRACMPTVETVAAPMRFRLWSPEAAMSCDPYGIPVPAERVESLPPDVVLLPLVAFDAAGYRLGYGGGYFDRTLAALQPRPLSCGVGFELARTADLHPQPHDIPLDWIVTEAGLVRKEVA